MIHVAKVVVVMAVITLASGFIVALSWVVALNYAVILPAILGFSIIALIIGGAHDWVKKNWP